MDFEQYDSAFRDLHVASARVDRLWSGARWTEGPVWFADMNCLLFSDIPNDRILRFSPDPVGSDGLGSISVFRAPSRFANGHTRDRQGRLVSCQHGTRSVTRTEWDGTITVLADSYRGRRLNAPNDVVVSADGAIWFTDPTYGSMSDYEGVRGEIEQDARNVFRIDPATGALESMCDDFTQPNGLAFAPDEGTLYVADSARSHDPDFPPHVRTFRVGAQGRLSGGEEFCLIDSGLPDGIRVDDAGRLWSSAFDGVHCFDTAGQLIGKVKVPETVSNLCFGGARRNRLYMTGTTSLYAVTLCVNGAQRP
ncbi:MAG: SMP-30/gluconolactonase/LRE family protein [Rubellimicrobium sp.]|nr:SMP-30/gluconolactonase/LRE family protein [Rubellimicrobium sp.]